VLLCGQLDTENLTDSTHDLRSVPLASEDLVHIAAVHEQTCPLGYLFLKPLLFFSHAKQFVFYAQTKLRKLAHFHKKYPLQ